MNIIKLPYHLLVKISCNLIDRDLKALGVTSKKMQKLAIKQLEARDKELEELLSTHIASRCFNISSLKAADLFLIGDNHEDPKCQDAQVELIKFLRSRGSVIVLAESTPSMKVILDDSDLQVVGWDDDKAIEKLESVRKRLYRQKEKAQYIINPEFDKTQEQIQKKISEYITKLNQREEEWRTVLASTFPNRTAAMIQTLKKIGGFTSQLGWSHPKIVLISGMAHLEWFNNRMGSRLLNENCSLMGLYEQLQHHRASILLPTWSLSLDFIERIKKIKDPVHDLPYKITRIVAKCDVGFGNTLYVRGNAENVLNWKNGVQMVNENGDTWTFATCEDMPHTFPCKVLINDVRWENGNDHTAAGGQKNVIASRF